MDNKSLSLVRFNLIIYVYFYKYIALVESLEYIYTIFSCWYFYRVGKI
jgi:hypothetical protein